MVWEWGHLGCGEECGEGCGEGNGEGWGQQRIVAAAQ